MSIVGCAERVSGQKHHLMEKVDALLSSGKMLVKTAIETRYNQCQRNALMFLSF
jgi:hypothetical protein